MLEGRLCSVFLFNHRDRKPQDTEVDWPAVRLAF
jgi:hypothetical protein